MKFAALVAIAARLSVGHASPHGPGGDDEMPVAAASAVPAAPAAPASPASPAVPMVPVAPEAKTQTPAGCKKLNTDTDWPTLAEWQAALPEVVARPLSVAKGATWADYRLRAETYGDVQDAVKFAAKHNIRLTIINSGHDFLARNDAPTGLRLDVSLLQGIKVLESFTPTAQGAEAPKGKVNTIVPVPGKQAAVTIGAGISTQKLNDAIHPSKLFTIGAAHGSVSVAGGWGQTGGHGPLTAQYGLGADQFLEFKVVTADGELKVANKVVNQDLFWALRGGGGGTFGVVVEATVKAFPEKPITIAQWWLNTTVANGDGLWEAYAYLHTQFPYLVDRGITGYYYVYPNVIRGLFAHENNNGSASAAAAWKPIFDHIAKLPGMTPPATRYTQTGSYKEYFDTVFGAIDGSTKCPGGGLGQETKSGHKKRHGPGGDSGMAEPMTSGLIPLDSRLLGKEHFEHPDFLKAIRAGGQGLQGHLVSGGKAAKPEDDTAVLPAWRTTYTHVIGSKIPGLTSGLDAIRKIAPAPISGAYANEAFYAEENWKETFWGSNYAKLSQIKTKYDPNLVFWTSPGINADLMQVVNGRVCKVEGVYNSTAPPRIDYSGRPGRAAGVQNPTAIDTSGANDCWRKDKPTSTSGK